MHLWDDGSSSISVAVICPSYASNTLTLDVIPKVFQPNSFIRAVLMGFIDLGHFIGFQYGQQKAKPALSISGTVHSHSGLNLIWC